MQNFNYHTHTYRCGHSDQSISDEEYVKMFLEKGFKKIAFTDHCPYKKQLDFRYNMRMDYSQKEEYYESIRKLKEKYKGKIDIEVGFEFEYAPNQKEYLKRIKSETDKMVMGQHVISDDNGENVKIIGWSSNTDEDLYRYAYLIEEAMKEGIPDVIVHPDCYMLSKSSFGEVEEKVAHTICKAAEKYQVPLEINLTRIAMLLDGRTNDIKYPCKGFWEIASNYNVKVIYGVDAHFRFQLELYEDSVKYCEDYLGKKIISKFHFCEEDLK